MKDRSHFSLGRASLGLNDSQVVIHQLTFCLAWHHHHSDDVDVLIFFSGASLLCGKKRAAAQERNPFSLQVSAAINFTQILSFPE